MSSIAKRFIVTLPYTLPTFVASFTAVAVAFLVCDFFVSAYVWSVGLAVSTILATIVFKYVSPHIETNKGNVIATSVVFLLCGVWFVGNAYYTSQHLFVDRDPGIYADTAVWLMKHDNLHIPHETDVFNNEVVVKNGSGFNISSHNQNEVAAQGAHALPALLGLAGRVVGINNMLHVVPIFGAIALFTFYGFLRLLLKKQRWAIAGTVLLSVCLPMIYFSRDTYSEPLALIFVFGALSALYFAHKTNSKAMWLAAGVVTGAGALTRIDALLSIGGMFVAVFIAVAFADKKRRVDTLKGAAIFIVTTLVLFGLAYIDLAYLSSAYLRNLAPLLRAQIIAVTAIAVLGFIYSFLPRFTKNIHTWYGKYKKRIAVGLAYITGVVGLVLLSRPLWYVGKDTIDNPHLRKVQAENGLPIDGFRNYAENTLDWMGWYIGYFTVVLALIGLVIVVVKLCQSRNILYISLAAVVGGAAIVYLNVPSITPDHIWAARRFLPVIIPGLITLAMLTLATIELQKPKLPQRFRVHVTPILFGLLGWCLIATFITTHPFTTTRTYDRQLAQIEQVCDTLPENAALLLRGGYSYVAVQTFRSVCGDVVVGFSHRAKVLSEAEIKQISDSVRSHGKELYIGALLTNVHELNDNGVVKPLNTSVSEEYEATLVRPPALTVPYDLNFYLGRVDERGRVLPVE